MKKITHIMRDVAQHWVGDGFPVRSLFSYADRNQFDPFLLLDYAGPHEFAPGQAKRGVGEHPHRGFETVTILYQGELEHRDSSGSHGVIGPGDVQWMTAASGIVHDEFHSQRFAEQGGVLEMIQLWVNLPAIAKSAPPRYQSLLAADIPNVQLPNGAGSARVIAGSFLGTRGPAETFTPLNIWDVELNAGASLNTEIPSGHTSLIVVQRGRVGVNEESLDAAELALFERSADALELCAETDSRTLMLSGQPLNEPIFGQGPFVMNTRDEIRLAIQDYQAGKMGSLT